MFVECFNVECLFFMCSTTTGVARHDSLEIVHLNCKLLPGAKVNWLTLLLIQSLNSLILCCSAQVISNGGFPDGLKKRLL